MSEQVSVLDAPRASDRDRCCIDCGQPITTGSRTGRCRRCAIAASRGKPRTCSSCGKRITPHSQTGLCLDCWIRAGRPAGEAAHANVCRHCLVPMKGKGKDGLCSRCYVDPELEPEKPAHPLAKPLTRTEYLERLRTRAVLAERQGSAATASAYRMAIQYLGRASVPSHARWILASRATEYLERARRYRMLGDALEGIVAELAEVVP